MTLREYIRNIIKDILSEISTSTAGSQPGLADPLYPFDDTSYVGMGSNTSDAYDDQAKFEKKGWGPKWT